MGRILDNGSGVRVEAVRGEPIQMGMPTISLHANKMAFSP
jgi:hypothetical protein